VGATGSTISLGQEGRLVDRGIEVTMEDKDILALSVNQLNKEGNPLVSSLSRITFYLDHIECERYRVRIPAA
jgi:hypothetical protein